MWSYSLSTLSCVFSKSSDKSARLSCGPTVCPPVPLLFGVGFVWSYSLPTLSCVLPTTSDKSSRVLCGPTVCPPVTLPLGLCFVWSYSLPTFSFVLPSKSSDKFCFFVCLPTWGVGGVQYNMSSYTLNVVGV